MSIRPSAVLTRAALLVAAGLVACSESAVQPTSELIATPGSFAAARSANSGKYKAPVLRRTSQLRDDEIACAMIPRAGRTVALSRSGLTVTFNAKSVSHDTYVCLVARSGDKMAYSFYPHGLRFDTPIDVEQTLTGTTADKDPALATSLFFGYLENDVDDDIDGDGVGTMAQVFASTIRIPSSARTASTVPASVRFSTDHFSGYALASGRTGTVEFF